MLRVFNLCFVLLAWPAILFAEGPTAVPEAAAKSEKARYDEGDILLSEGATKSAATLLEHFLEEHPRSKLAPQAAYKIGCAYLLEGKPADANKAFELLVRNYSSSFWARLALQVHYDEEMLFNLADEKLKQGRTASSQEDLRTSREVFELLLARYPQAKKKFEILYKIGRFDELQNLDKDGDWGKLASLAKGGLEAFRNRMDELVQLGEDEAAVLFLQCADKYAPALAPAELAKCLYYRAHCLDKLKRNPEAIELYQTIIREHASSPYAVEAAFFLAEDHFTHKRFAEAQTAYRAFAKQYPQHERAVLARNWADWIDELEPSWREIPELLSSTLQSALRANAGIALKLKLTTNNPRAGMEGRIAIQDSGHSLLSIFFGGNTFLFANNQEGTWYRPPGQSCLIKPRQRLSVPPFAGELKTDLANSNYSFGFRFGGDLESGRCPPWQLSHESKPYAASDLYPVAHLHRVTRDGKSKGTTYHFQRAKWQAVLPDSLEVDIDESAKICEVRDTRSAPDGESATCTLSEIRLGAALPEEFFAVPVPAGFEIREVDTINPIELVSDLVRLVAPVWEQLTGKHAAAKP